MVVTVLLDNHRNIYEKPNNALVAATNHFTFNDGLWNLCKAQINLLEIHVVLGVDNLLCRLWLSVNRAECLVETKEYVGWYIVSPVLFTGDLLCLVSISVGVWCVFMCVCMCIDF